MQGCEEQADALEIYEWIGSVSVEVACGGGLGRDQYRRDPLRRHINAKRDDPCTHRSFDSHGVVQIGAGRILNAQAGVW